MLRLLIPEGELFDDNSNKFIQQESVVLELEHSLVSLSKWESIYQKPFLGEASKTPEETLGYVQAMVLSGDDSLELLSRLTKEHFDQINEYISSTQSATTFSDSFDKKKGGRPEVITSELIYYWLVAFAIDWEAQTWHLNRLFSLIQICNIKNSKPKKMSRREIAERNRTLNDQRRAATGSSG